MRELGRRTVRLVLSTWVGGLIAVQSVVAEDTVVVSYHEVNQFAAVRYAYTSDPAGVNLYNRDGLPASPFRTDDW